MKRSILIILPVIALCLIYAPSVFAIGPIAVNRTSSTVIVNDAIVDFDAYNIENNNFFKLRDIAFALNGSDKQFEVEWENANNAILLTSGMPYTIIGSEMINNGMDSSTAILNNARIDIDGSSVDIIAYSINGYNYFKLRDIGRAFDFGVDWDDEADAIIIDTSKGYAGQNGINEQNIGNGTLSEPYNAGDAVILVCDAGNQYEIFFEERIEEGKSLEMSNEEDPKYNSHSFGIDDTLYLAKINIKKLMSVDDDDLFGVYHFQAYKIDGTQITWNTLMYPIKPDYYSSLYGDDYFWVQLIVPKETKVILGFQDRDRGLVYFDLEKTH